ncbi:hypothetical protein HK096_008022, partial [Nowakowskiella sp. JEL0078]
MALGMTQNKSPKPLYTFRGHQTEVTFCCFLPSLVVPCHDISFLNQDTVNDLSSNSYFVSG